jgi:arylsulfatase
MLENFAVDLPDLFAAHARPVARGAAILVALAWLSGAAAQPAAPDAIVGKTYAQSHEGTPPALKIAKGAPNIIWILIDDAGFGSSSAFGGLVNTPTLEALANDGLRYANFHTTGVCSPTRAALLTGRNHNRVGMGLFPHPFLSAEFPGYSGRVGPQDGTIAEYLRERGYSTYQLGKWHQTPDAEQTDLGPFDHWPSGKGFDHNFGFLGGAEDQYKPDLVEDNTHVKPDGRHLNAQLVDKAIYYIDRQEKLNSAKPFFMYLATGATHSPHQVDEVWIDKYKGKFDAGWDVYREQVLARQKQLGLVPQDAQLPDRDPRVPAWDSLSADQKKIYARFMESYAGFFEYTDAEFGRLIAYLRSRALLDNTAIFVVIGDNGASKEGSYNGSVVPELGGPPIRDNASQIKELLRRYDQIGTRNAYSNYPIGWSEAANTPFRFWKADANSEGGTRNPLIVHWPAGLGGHKDEVRQQYGHVIDLLPTTLEIAGATVPPVLHGVSQDPIQGVSLTYSFDDASAPTRHREQYFFLFGAGAIVHDGWKASFGYRPDFVDLYGTYPPPEKVINNAGKEVWELYDLNTDFNERHNVAAENPAKLAELQDLFDAQAKENNVYPLINWSDVDGKVKAYFRAHNLSKD